MKEPKDERSDAEIRFEKERICISDSSKMRIIKIDDIAFLGAENYYTIFHLNTGKDLIVSKTLKFYELRLSQRFLRIHRSSLVNLDYVVEYDIGRNKICLSTGHELAVSRRRVAEVIRRLRDI